MGHRLPHVEAAGQRPAPDTAAPTGVVVLDTLAESGPDPQVIHNYDFAAPSLSVAMEAVLKRK